MSTKKSTPKVNFDKVDTGTMYRNGSLVSDGHILVDNAKIDVSGRLLVKLNAEILVRGASEGVWRDGTFYEKAPDLARFVKPITDTIEVVNTQLLNSTFTDPDYSGVYARAFIANGEVRGMDERYYQMVKTFDIRFYANDNRFMVFNSDDEFVAVVMPVMICEVNTYTDVPVLKSDCDYFIDRIKAVNAALDAWNQHLADKQAAKMAEKAKSE